MVLIIVYLRKFKIILVNAAITPAIMTLTILSFDFRSFSKISNSPNATVATNAPFLSSKIKIAITTKAFPNGQIMVQKEYE